jgi:uncharacterized protein (TIGR02996 family)
VSVSDVERQLLDAIIHNPDDEDARAIYADWLEERGDPRGEYLRLEAQLHRIPPRLESLSAAIDPAWLESVARLYDVWLDGAGPNKIAVIKEIRTHTGLGLKDTVDIVNLFPKPQLIRHRIPRGQAADVLARFIELGARGVMVPHLLRPDEAPGDVDCELVAVVEGETIRAIKLVRELTGLTLKDAKDAVGRVAAGSPLPIARRVHVQHAAAIAKRFDGIGVIEQRRADQHR